MGKPVRSRLENRCRRVTRGVSLDALESRVLLSVVTWTGGGDGLHWSDNNNWDTHAAPINGDDVVVQGTTTDDIAGLVLHDFAFTGDSTFTTAVPSGDPLRLTVSNNLSFAGTVNWYGFPLIMTSAAPVITTAAGASVLWSAPATVPHAVLTLDGSGSLVFGDGAYHSELFVLTAETHVTDGTVTFLGAANAKVVVTGGTAIFAENFNDYPLGGLQATGGTVKLSAPLTVAGDVLLGAGSTFVGNAPLTANSSVTLGATLSPTTTYNLIIKHSAGPVVGTFAGLPDGALFDVNGTAHRIYYHALDGNGVYQTIGDVNPVTATLQAPIAANGDPSTTFTITYSDASGVTTDNIHNNNALVKVTGPNGFSAFAAFVSLTGPSTAVVATYRIDAPGGAWDAAEDGTYTVTVLPGVLDYLGNPMAETVVGTFGVGAIATPVPDSRVFLPADSDVAMAGGSTTTFSLVFQSDVLLSAMQANGHLVTVTGLHGFTAFATLVSTAAAGATHRVTFRVAAPGGRWDASDAGAYTVTIAGQTVVDNAGQPARFYMSPSMLFDERYYDTHNADVAAAIASGAVASGWAHFMAHGQFEQRDPSTVYDEKTYLLLNPDVAAAVKGHKLASGFEHLLRYGLAEGRAVTPLFNDTYYLAHNKDVAAAVRSGAIASGLAHFLKFGQYESRDPSAYFDASYYQAHNAGASGGLASGAYPSLFAQFLGNGEAAGVPASANFDEAFYDTRYPDVAAAIKAGLFKSGLEHYLLFGKQEGRVAIAAP